MKIAISCENDNVDNDDGDFDDGDDAVHENS